MGRQPVKVLPTHETLESYLHQIARKDISAHGALYDATSAKLFAVSLRILSDVTDAEDAVHDTYVKVWKNADRYKSTGHSPMTWLITLARNTAIDKLRARRRNEPLENYAESLAEPGPTPEDMAVRSDEGARLWTCLDELPMDRRRAVRGAYMEGFSYAELAAQAAVPLNTMRTWLRRSLISLRECLER